MSSRATAQYLARYAEAETAMLEGFPPRTYRHCLVIPCLRETPAFAERLMHRPPGNDQLLVIVVINQSSPEPEPLNQALLAYFYSLTAVWQNQHLRLCHGAAGSPWWLVVDRCSLTLPAKQGVGLARKIGCDIAVALQYKHHLRSQWLHSTDADAHLPPDYFALPEAPFTAAVYPFAHIRAGARADVWQATELYEQALRYYVAGLKWAGSPYAHQPIGSTLAFTVSAYCQARGFPKRSAGEDFYLLNKLSKLGAVFSPEATIKLEARASNRVPFGTGPGVQAITDLADPAQEFCYYHPQTFVQLKAWLAAMPEVWPNIQASRPPLAELNLEAQQALTEAGISKLWPHITTQTRDAPSSLRALNIWFDGFQTLKFIRRMQATRYPALPLWRCLEEAPFCC